MQLLAEMAAEGLGAALLCLIWLGVVLSVLTAIVGAAMRSKATAGAAVYLWVLVSVFLFPWLGFFPQPSQDPDTLVIQVGHRKVAEWWVASGVLLAGTLIWTFWGCRVNSPRVCAEHSTRG